MRCSSACLNGYHFRLLTLPDTAKYEFPAEKFDSISTEARDLVVKLLCMDVAQRPTCAQALEHAWFKADTGAVIQVRIPPLTHPPTRPYTLLYVVVV